MKAVDFKGKYKQITYSARINFDKNLLGKPFIDYTVDGDTVTATTRNYFDAIKKYMNIEYSKDSLPAVTSLNGYLRYAMPEDILPVAKQKEKTERPDVDMIIDNVGFEITAYDNPKNVTEALIDSSDAVISLSENFNTNSEKLIRRY